MSRTQIIDDKTGRIRWVEIEPGKVAYLNNGERIVPPLPEPPQAEEFMRHWKDSVPFDREKKEKEYQAECNRELAWFAFLVVLIVAISAPIIYYSSQEQRRYLEQVGTDGAEAFQFGIPPEANPYTGDDLRSRWLNGWVKAKRGEK